MQMMRISAPSWRAVITAASLCLLGVGYLFGPSGVSALPLTRGGTGTLSSLRSSPQLSTQANRGAADHEILPSNEASFLLIGRHPHTYSSINGGENHGTSLVQVGKKFLGLFKRTKASRPLVQGTTPYVRGEETAAGRSKELHLATQSAQLSTRPGETLAAQAARSYGPQSIQSPSWSSAAPNFPPRATPPPLPPKEEQGVNYATLTFTGPPLPPRSAEAPGAGTPPPRPSAPKPHEKTIYAAVHAPPVVPPRVPVQTPKTIYVKAGPPLQPRAAAEPAPASEPLSANPPPLPRKPQAWPTSGSSSSPSSVGQESRAGGKGGGRVGVPLPAIPHPEPSKNGPPPLPPKKTRPKHAPSLSHAALGTQPAGAPSPPSAPAPPQGVEGLYAKVDKSRQPSSPVAPPPPRAEPPEPAPPPLPPRQDDLAASPASGQDGSSPPPPAPPGAIPPPPPLPGAPGAPAAPKWSDARHPGTASSPSESEGRAQRASGAGASAPAITATDLQSAMSKLRSRTVEGGRSSSPPPPPTSPQASNDNLMLALKQKLESRKKKLEATSDEDTGAASGWETS